MSAVSTAGVLVAGSPALGAPATDADGLQIAGLVALSTCDWPGKLVATVFLQGCPLACTYCHNPGLLDPRTPGTVTWQQVRDLLARRHGLLDGVVFSGGEPTRQAGLAAAMREVSAAGYGVGLHTAGVYPKRFAEVLDLCDWIGLDIKAPEQLYGAVTGVAAAAAKAFACLRLALGASVDLQVRTTVDPMVLAPADVAELMRTLAALGVRNHVLQTVRTEGTTADFTARLEAFRALSGAN
ncbi:anaerobic ribonucleoside-triphosphate reductase activating protein [Cryobacterium frigoriphilum]|uniref:Anaerobic ribonucleoside-triphosphate reductase activating protein n=1 Tax=Cryobacterium frigoriphilum TaxID=1259150 RepID=A0A4R8ZUW4_9MICO|nr:anaerobic ribonucleoside-triphosphate reductase activating protein [Cryobacterium frigoriphilum]TFD46557.1 anaerobic ribonucleoside-triphosphate reductase activating protein [Cryobacterium frigoriphilum]